MIQHVCDVMISRQERFSILKWSTGDWHLLTIDYDQLKLGNGRMTNRVIGIRFCPFCGKELS